MQGKPSPQIQEFIKSLDDAVGFPSSFNLLIDNPSSFPFCIEFALMLKLFQEWQSSLYSLLQNQTFNQVEVDLFELMCKVLDQNLFAQVDWARNSYYFKELKVGDEFSGRKN